MEKIYKKAANVAFIQKVLIHLSFSQTDNSLTDKPHCFPEHEIWNCEIWKGPNHVIKVQEVDLKAQIRLHFTIWAFRATSGSYLTYLSPLIYLKFKIQAQENDKVCLFEEMTNISGVFKTGATGAIAPAILKKRLIAPAILHRPFQYILILLIIYY